MPEIIVKLGDNVVQKFFFVKETMSIGRGSENEIVIENLAISRTHSTIKCEDGKYILNDLGSSNGTYVNGVKVKRTELMDKDVITLGKHKLFFYDQRAAEAVRRPSMDADRTMLVTAMNVGVLSVTKGRQKGQSFTLDQPAAILGKGSECQIQLNDWFVSKQHAVIEKRNEEFLIRDLNSWRHTRVNGEVVNEANLINGDVIQLGPTVTLNFTIESSLRELDEKPGVVARGETVPAERVKVPSGLNGANGHGNEEWVKQYQRAKELDERMPEPQPITVKEQAESEEPVAVGAEVEHAEAEAAGMAGFANADQYGAMPETAGETADEANSAAAMAAEAQPEIEAEVEASAAAPEPVEELAVVEAAEAEEPEADVEVEENLDPKTAEEVALWKRALQNPSAVIRKQAARRLKALTGKDYEY